MDHEIIVFSGNSNPAFARRIADYLETDLGEAKVGRFSDGEVQVEIQTSVREADVFVVQSLSDPVNDHLMELLALNDAVRRSSANSLTSVVPYFGYARQDRQPKPRTPITSKLVADMLEVSGVDRVVGCDLHADQITGFFTQPFEHLYARPVFLPVIRRLRAEADDGITLVSPDAGGVDRTRMYSQALDEPLAIMDKRRSAPNVSEVINLIGEVAGRRAVIVDDIVDTAGTLCESAAALDNQGASAVYALATHPVLSGPAVERIGDSTLDRVFVSDTVPLSEPAQACDKIEVVSVGKLFGEAIKRIHGGVSVSSIFDSEFSG
jgi:ribose-phosphate pyrophosphokinase